MTKDAKMVRVQKMHTGQDTATAKRGQAVKGVGYEHGETGRHALY